MDVHCDNTSALWLHHGTLLQYQHHALTHWRCCWPEWLITGWVLSPNCCDTLYLCQLSLSEVQASAQAL